jgi:hypothetical protein
MSHYFEYLAQMPSESSSHMNCKTNLYGFWPMARPCLQTSAWFHDNSIFGLDEVQKQFLISSMAVARGGHSFIVNGQDTMAWLADAQRHLQARHFVPSK